MTDVLTKRQRSYCMSQIRGKGTKQEIILKNKLRAAGLSGYRMHFELAGKPDIAYPGHKLAIFLDGCFWHKCPMCYNKPRTNRTFWLKKLGDNVIRDKKINQQLKKAGWKVIRFWEHDIRKNSDKCIRTVRKVLNVAES